MDNNKKAPATPPVMAGPHTCSKVANRISSILKNALIETSRLRDRPLDQDEIAHVIDLVMDLQELFSVFQHAYSNCVGLSQSGQLQEMDETTILRFVVGALCRDIMPKIFSAQISARGEAWKRAFVAGFSDYLNTNTSGTLASELQQAYQALVISSDQEITPLTILHDPRVKKALGDALALIDPSSDPEYQQTVKKMERYINRELSIAFELRGPSPLRIYTKLARYFLDAIYRSSPSNAFRTEVLKAA